MDSSIGFRAVTNPHIRIHPNAMCQRERIVSVYKATFRALEMMLSQRVRDSAEREAI